MYVKRISNVCCFQIHTGQLEGSHILKMAPTPVSLQNLCLIYIIRFLELFPVDYLALLPVTVRQWLLENLPPVDICRLEQSKFSEGLDIDGVWKKLSDNSISHILALYAHYSNKSNTAFYLCRSHKDYFFNQIYSYLATQHFHVFGDLNFSDSLAEHRNKIVQCLCTPLRPQTQHKAPTLVTLQQLSHWSLLDSNQDLPIATPNRYLPYYQPLSPSLTAKDSIKSIVFLTPTLCQYYPTELDININGFFNTTLGKLLNLTDDSTIYTRFFQQVEFLCFTLHFTENFANSKFAIPNTKQQCQKCIQTILPPARRVLQQFAIRANSPEALGYMLECCIPILQDTLESPQQSASHNYSTLLPSLCHVTVALHRRENFSPLSEQHGRLLQHFSTIFSGSQFSSFTIDGVKFQDTPSSQPFGSILHSFLTSSTTHEQRLIFQNVTVHSTSLPPPVVTPECGLHYKSLIIEKSVIPNSIINWLLKECELHLKTLQLDFEEAEWYSTGPLAKIVSKCRP